MNRVTITVGVGFTWNSEPLSPDQRAEAISAVHAHLTSVYGGYTEELIHGGWNRRGVTVTEPGRRYIMLTDVADRAEDSARFIGRAFHQRAVMLEIQPLDSSSGLIEVY